MDILTQKVKDGIAHHNTACSGACSACPYKESYGKCMRMILNDANEVIDYWKGKYESTLLQQPTMILNIPHQKILSDPIDIRTTLKEAEALRKMADAGNKASEALRDVAKALHDLKEVFPDD